MSTGDKAREVDSQLRTLAADLDRLARELRARADTVHRSGSASVAGQVALRAVQDVDRIVGDLPMVRLRAAGRGGWGPTEGLD